METELERLGVTFKHARPITLKPAARSVKTCMRCCIGSGLTQAKV